MVVLQQVSLPSTQLELEDCSPMPPGQAQELQAARRHLVPASIAVFIEQRHVNRSINLIDGTRPSCLAALVRSYLLAGACQRRAKELQLLANNAV